MRLVAPHWFCNQSSVPLSVRYGSGLGDAVTSAEPHSSQPHFFSMAEGEIIQERALSKPFTAFH